MKKRVIALLMVIAVLALAACGGGGNTSGGSSGGSTSGDAAETVKVDKLTVMYVPSRPADEIISATSGLGDMLISAFAEKGFEVGEVEITVSDDYNACGEALSAGSADIGYVPGGTYALYGDEIQLVLTATRDNLSNDTTNPADWNGDANATTRQEGVPVTYYKGLIYAAPTEKGKALAAKANSGEAITWEELADCSWAIGSVTSGAAYIYPNLWLKENYDKIITDLPTALNLKYPEAFQQAAAEQVDIIVCYADGRQDYEEQWTGEWGRTDSIWNELNVIGVTQNIYNDTVCLAKAGPNADVLTSPEFIEAFSDIMMHLGDTPEGQEIIGIYSHTGYQPANDADYDVTRNALAAME